MQVLHQALVLFCDDLHDKGEIRFTCFLIFIKGFLIDLETSHLKKNTKVNSVQKIWAIKLFLSILQLKSTESSEFGFGFQHEMQTARTLFFHMVFKKFIEKYNKPILVSTILLTDINISLFNMFCDLFSIIIKNSIKSGKMQLC